MGPTAKNSFLVTRFQSTPFSFPSNMQKNENKFDREVSFAKIDISISIIDIGCYPYLFTVTHPLLNQKQNSENGSSD